MFSFALIHDVSAVSFSNKLLQISGGKTRFLKHVHPLNKLLEPPGQYTAPILPPVKETP